MRHFVEELCESSRIQQNIAFLKATSQIIIKDINGNDNPLLCVSSFQPSAQLWVDQDIPYFSISGWLFDMAKSRIDRFGELLNAFTEEEIQNMIIKIVLIVSDALRNILLENNFCDNHYNMDYNNTFEKECKKAVKEILNTNYNYQRIMPVLKL